MVKLPQVGINAAKVIHRLRPKFLYLATQIFNLAANSPVLGRHLPANILDLATQVLHIRPAEQIPARIAIIGIPTTTTSRIAAVSVCTVVADRKLSPHDFASDHTSGDVL